MTKQFDPAVAARLALKYRQAKDQETLAKKEAEIAKEALIGLVGYELGQDKVKVEYPSCDITIGNSHNSTISKELLIKAGVSEETIEACTKISPYVLIRVTDRR